ncbi:uncharacterized protein [Misgurnus anguillicaudatus]|uniref:uncharacterized protein isoform X1 n=1 Tax=Misgurnus anguillicaudatus TaxID=75329 RepID=UPI003CCF8010
MKTFLAALILLASVIHTVLSCPVCKGEGLKCFTCVAHNQDECDRQGSTVCPANADACSTITGAHTVLKSCSYKSFCDKSHMSNGELKCCFSDDCNGPHRSHSHGENNTAVTLSSSPALLLGILLFTALRSL